MTIIVYGTLARYNDRLFTYLKRTDNYFIEEISWKSH